MASRHGRCIPCQQRRLRSETESSPSRQCTSRLGVHAVATVLRDGRVVTGGEDGNRTLDSAETYNVLTGKGTLLRK